MSIEGIVINWFDFVAMGVLAIGIVRGRKRGMSEELLDLFKWLVIVVSAGLCYRPVGELIKDYTHVSPVAAFLAAYLAILIAVRMFFGWIRRMVGEKLIGSDVFGSWEYYLGMGAGAVRFACVLLVAMALLNAGSQTPEQLAAMARSQRKNFEGISFPTLGSIQHTVFTGSVSGKLVQKYLVHELIVVTPADRTAMAADTLGRREERAVSEILGEKR